MPSLISFLFLLTQYKHSLSWACTSNLPVPPNLPLLQQHHISQTHVVLALTFLVSCLFLCNYCRSLAASVSSARRALLVRDFYSGPQSCRARQTQNLSQEWGRKKGSEHHPWYGGCCSALCGHCLVQSGSPGGCWNLLWVISKNW